MDNQELYKKIQIKVSDMQMRRQPILSFWQDIQKFMLPWHGRNLSGDENISEVDGDLRDHSEIFSQVPEDSIDRLAAGFQFGLTPRTEPWFAMILDDMSLVKKHSIRTYLHEVERRMQLVFSRSNVYDVLHHFFIELIAFGTAAMAELEDEESVVRFVPFTAGEYLISQNARGEVDTFYRELWMSARQMWERFGEDNLSQSALNAYENCPEKLFRVCQMIEPNIPEIKGLRLAGKKFRSMYYEKARSVHDDKFLEISGYNEFPVMVARWRVVGNDVWGRGPGMKVLPDVKSLYKIAENTLIALDKVLDPPLIAPGSLKNDYIDQFPGGVTFSDDMVGADAFRPLYQIRPDIKSAEYIKEQLAAAIQRGFFNDIFLMLTNTPDTKRMTAYEVQGRKEEKMTMLGPVLGRLQGELLAPIIDRTFAIMYRNGLLPEAPAEIQGKELDIKYLSILARAQEMGAVNAMMQLLNFTGALAQVKQEVLDLLNADGMFREFADALGVPPDALVPDSEVQRVRAARAEQQQMAQQMAMTQGMAQTAQVASKAQMGEENLLQRAAKTIDEGS